MLGYSENRVLKGSSSDCDGVKIGDQCWALKNLDVDDGLGGIYPPNGDVNNVTIHGYLYTWDAAVRVSSGIVGYHLPTYDEVYALLYTILSGRTASLAGFYDLWPPGALRDNVYFGQSGFNAPPSGYYNGNFLYFGSLSYYWLSTLYSSTKAHRLSFLSSRSYAYLSTYALTYALSVRLIQDV